MTITSQLPTSSTATPPGLTIVPNITQRSEFTEVLLSHFRSLTAYSTSLCKDQAQAKDILQEASITAWKNIKRFDPEADFGRWMRGIIRNKFRESVRLKVRETPLEESDLERLEAVFTDAPDSELFDRLDNCRQKLPADLRSAIDATYEEGRTSKEAAEVLDTTPSALRKRLERARTALRQCLSN